MLFLWLVSMAAGSDRRGVTGGHFVGCYANLVMNPGLLPCQYVSLNGALLFSICVPIQVQYALKVLYTYCIFVFVFSFLFA
jgi:hypothetical protein